MVTTEQVRDWRAAEHAFFGICALLFAISAMVTVLWCTSMPAMDGMPWMRMPGETWLGVGASFTAMWTVMMIAMMLPSLAPTLWRYREATSNAGETRPDRLTALAGVAYFVAWTVFGMAVFPVGVALASTDRSAAGVVVIMAGAFQFTAWKAHHLACCREAPAAGTAWRTGLRLGLHCICGCAGLTAILLVLGVMDWRAMAVVTAAITAERVAPAGERVARMIGVIAVGVGLFLVVQYRF